MNTLPMTVVTALTLVLLTGCGGSGTKETSEPSETAISGTATILVDAQIIEMLGPAKVLYDSANPQATIVLRSVEASDATFDLLRHDARGIIIARDWLPSEAEDVAAEKGIDGYPRTMLAKDALVFFVAKDFPYDTMHADHIRRWLSTGKFPKSAYPKIKTTPVAVVPGSQSSIYGNIVNVVLNGQKPIDGTVTSLKTADSVRAHVRADNRLIGVGLLSQLIKDTTVKMLRLSWTDSTGVYEHPRPVHQGYLVQGLYPFPVPIWFILRDRANNYNLPSGFMLFLARDGNAQRTFLDAGIEPGFAKIELNLEE